MQKQKLQQNQKINISVEQIQFLNLLQIPAINLEQREGDIAGPLEKIQEKFPEVEIGSYPYIKLSLIHI